MVAMTSSTIMIVPSSSLVNGSNNVNNKTIESGGFSLFINGQGPMRTFNLILKCFRELWKNYQGVQMEKLWSL
jgi:hypothetical protein